MRLETHVLPLARNGAGVVQTGSGSAQLIDRLIRHTVQVRGTFVATFDLEVSHDGVTWFKAEVGIAAPAIATVFGSFKYIRANTTAYTSENLGAPIVITYAGFDARTE